MTVGGQGGDIVSGNVSMITPAKQPTLLASDTVHGKMRQKHVINFSRFM